MIYQQFLYSRSLSEDYRWIIIPSDVSEFQLNHLKKFYDLFDDRKKAIIQTQLPAIYCITIANTTFFFRCSPTKKTDIHGRGIYSMQGISIQKLYHRHFWFVLPWFLANYSEFLNIWEGVDYQTADKLAYKTSQFYEYDLSNVDKFIANISKSIPNIELNSIINHPLELPFNKQGYQSLVRLIASPQIPMVDFAFGATIEMKAFHSFAIIALATNTSSSNTPIQLTVEEIPEQTPNANPDRLPNTISQKDQLDRFDPRKKEQEQPKPDNNKTSFFSNFFKILGFPENNDDKTKK